MDATAGKDRNDDVGLEPAVLFMLTMHCAVISSSPTISSSVTSDQRRHQRDRS
jgi:hypothetical protein